MSIPTPTLPPGSTILVIGATSCIGSHIIKQFLALGYKVRGTDYSLLASTFLTEDVFKSETLNGQFTFTHIPDLLAPDAFESCIHDASAIIFVASMATSSDPNDVIPFNIEAMTNCLATAARTPSITQFIHTSSIGAAYTPIHPSAHVHLTSASWNETATKLVWTPPFGPERPPIVYMASKMAAERALWEFVDEAKPGFVVNTILPFFVCGKMLSESQNPSSNYFVRMLFEKESVDPTLLRQYETFSYVNVRDVALLHVAATLDPGVKDQRIFAVAEHSNWNDMLAIMRKIYPKKEFVEDLPELPRFAGTVDTSLGLELLKKWGNQDGWLDLEAGVRECLDKMK